MLRTSAALVAVGTLIVIASSWLSLALIGRATQAAGGAGLFVLAITLAGSPRRMGAISAAMGAFGAVGPLLGRRLTETVSWRATLAILAITLIAMPVVDRYLTRDTTTTNDRLDTWGALLVAVLSGSIVVIAATSPWALVATTISVVLLVIHIRRRPDGYVPITAVRSLRFLTATVLTIAVSIGYFTLLFVIPQLITTRAGWTKDQAATGQLVAMIIGSAATFGFTYSAARLGLARVRAVLIATGALAVLAAAYSSSPAELLASIGLALFAATSANATQVSEAVGAVPDRHKPTAIGLFTLSYLLGSAIGPALASTLVLS